MSPCKKARMQPSTLNAIKKKLKSGKSSRDVYVETREEAGGLSTCKVSARPRSVSQFKKLRNSQFTTKAVPTLQDLVKKTNLFCDSEMYRRQQTSE